MRRVNRNYHHDNHAAHLLDRRLRRQRPMTSSLSDRLAATGEWIAGPFYTNRATRRFEAALRNRQHRRAMRAERRR